MRFLAALLALSVVAVLGWQHQRYLKARRGPVQDRQPLTYSSSTFHVVNFLHTTDGADVLEALRKFRNEIEGAGHAKIVYAGRAALVGLKSEQLPETEWDAVVLVQYPSRDAYDAVAASATYRATMDGFAATYTHGIDRPALLNLGIPLMLLGMRAYEIATRTPSHFPLEPAAADVRDSRSAPGKERFARLEPLRELSEDAVVVVNLLKGGTAEQRAADRSYGMKMAGLFAEGGYGPMHMGRAVTVEGGARFDRVALVYYPGIDHMIDLMQSTFFNRIVGDKQPGDTMAVVTVPVLSRL